MHDQTWHAVYAAALLAQFKRGSLPRGLEFRRAQQAARSFANEDQRERETSARLSAQRAIDGAGA